MVRSSVRSSRQRITIIEKARELFWEKGYEGTSVKVIGNACGFEPGNIYNYFRSKEQLLYEVLFEELQWLLSLLKRFENDDSTSPVEQLHSCINIHFDAALGCRRSEGLLFDFALKNLSVVHRKSIVKLRDCHDNILCRIIRRGIERGDFAKVDEKVVANFISSMIVRSRIWFNPEGRLSSGEIAEILFHIITRGLLTRPKDTA